VPRHTAARRADGRADAVADWSAVMTSNRRERFVQQARAAVLALDQLSASGQSDRFPGLMHVRAAVQAMLEVIESGRAPSSGQSYAALNRLIIDQWPLVSAIGDDVAAIERQFLALIGAGTR
jgi:hypothetical protein